VRTGGTRREPNEVAALQGVLSVGCADNDRAVDDEQPLLLVLVVVRGRALTGREVVDEHERRLRPDGTRHVDSAFGVVGAHDVDLLHDLSIGIDRGRVRGNAC
jgi:hypothetical protein